MEVYISLLHLHLNVCDSILVNQFTAATVLSVLL